MHPSTAAHQRANRSGSRSPAPSGTAISSNRRFRPEVLGSPAGYVVPLGQRLLRPHLHFSLSPARLWICERVLQPRGLPRAENEKVPNLSGASLLRAVPNTPVDRSVAHGCCFSNRDSLRQFLHGSASTKPRTLVLAWVMSRGGYEFACATARTIASPHQQGTFTVELSPEWVTPSQRRL